MLEDIRKLLPKTKRIYSMEKGFMLFKPNGQTRYLILKQWTRLAVPAKGSLKSVETLILEYMKLQGQSAAVMGRQRHGIVYVVFDPNPYELAANWVRYNNLKQAVEML